MSGVITSLVTVFVLVKLMGLSHEEYVTLLPKSITTAIGMGVSDELGGYVTITVAVIVVTGVIGNIFGALSGMPFLLSSAALMPAVCSTMRASIYNFYIK